MLGGDLELTKEELAEFQRLAVERRIPPKRPMRMLVPSAVSVVFFNPWPMMDPCDNWYMYQTVNHKNQPNVGKLYHKWILWVVVLFRRETKKKNIHL